MSLCTEEIVWGKFFKLIWYCQQREIQMTEKLFWSIKCTPHKKVFQYFSCLLVIYVRWAFPQINYPQKLLCACAPSEISEYTYLSHACYYAANFSFHDDISNELLLVLFTFLKTCRVIWLYVNSFLTKPRRKNTKCVLLTSYG